MSFSGYVAKTSAYLDQVVTLARLDMFSRSFEKFYPDRYMYDNGFKCTLKALPVLKWAQDVGLNPIEFTNDSMFLDVATSYILSRKDVGKEFYWVPCFSELRKVLKDNLSLTLSIKSLDEGLYLVSAPLAGNQPPIEGAGKSDHEACISFLGKLKNVGRSRFTKSV